MSDMNDVRLGQVVERALVVIHDAQQDGKVKPHPVTVDAEHLLALAETLREVGMAHRMLEHAQMVAGWLHE